MLLVIRRSFHSIASKNKPSHHVKPNPSKQGKPIAAKSSRASLANLPAGREHLFGVQSVLGALSSNKRRIYKLFMKKSHSNSVDRVKKLQSIQDAFKMKTKLNSVVVNDFPQSLQDQAHQGVVMEVSTIKPDVLNCLTSTEAQSSQIRKYPLWIVLNEILDPQNIGAIIRTCVYFSVDGILISQRKTGPLNSTVSKASAGALEVAPIYHVGNLANFVQESQKAGWRVIGTSLGENTVPAGSLLMDRPTILILGNEGSGIKSRILELCDINVKIDAVKSPNTFEFQSLNVSVAGALLIHTLSKCSFN